MAKDECAHEKVRAICKLVTYDEYREIGTVIAEIEIVCTDCHARAVFEGVGGGLSPHAPKAGPFGDELRAPFKWACQ